MRKNEWVNIDVNSTRKTINTNFPKRIIYDGYSRSIFTTDYPLCIVIKESILCNPSIFCYCEQTKTSKTYIAYYVMYQSF